MDELFSRYAVTHVVNLPRSSHVDRSIVDPEVFLTTNVIGTQVLLDTARKHWNLAPDDKYSRAYQTA
jgi:dTDP-glucose 4,6-dehydratase